MADAPMITTDPNLAEHLARESGLYQAERVRLHFHVVGEEAEELAEDVEEGGKLVLDLLGITWPGPVRQGPLVKGIRAVAAAEDDAGRRWAVAGNGHFAVVSIAEGEEE